jgi:hypothetical protein
MSGSMKRSAGAAFDRLLAGRGGDRDRALLACIDRIPRHAALSMNGWRERSRAVIKAPDTIMALPAQLSVP